MSFAVFDIEATGLDVDIVDPHCIVINGGTGDCSSFRPHQIDEGVAELNRLVEEGVILAGHNIIEYDVPVLRRFGLEVPDQQLYDTLVVSRAAYAGNRLFQMDTKHLVKHPEKQPLLTPRGQHRLGAWGARLGCPKDEYSGGFETFNEEMLRYCIQDTVTNFTLLEFLRNEICDEAALLECEVASICRRMRLHGIGFDVRAAEELAIELSAKQEHLTQVLTQAFKPWYVGKKVKTPKRSMQSRKLQPGDHGYKNYEKDCSFTEVELVTFNPASTEHIANRLQAVYGWKPKQYTPGGKPQVTAEVLKELPYPLASDLADYQERKKILGYLTEGKNSWINAEKNGRIHGTVMPTGTVSSRASHSKPNTGNVPARSELGKKCRGLFRAAPGKVLVGADAAQLQLRVLAHYIALWDKGELARQCEEGDIHEYMRKGTGLYSRDRQKTWTYAKLFGASAFRLGRVAIDDYRDAVEKGLVEGTIPKLSAAKAFGEQTLENLGNSIPAFPLLDEELQKAAAEGKLRALDGRWIQIGSGHIAIAMLLQSGEACIMKKAMALAAPRLNSMGTEFSLWVHDEFQVECEAEEADGVGAALVTSLREAGEFFDLRVKIDGDYKVGKRWSETH